MESLKKKKNLEIGGTALSVLKLDITGWEKSINTPNLREKMNLYFYYELNCKKSVYFCSSE